MTTQLYFDYAAATPMSDSVLAAMQPYFQDKFYNPSANSLPAKSVKKDLEAARSTVAAVLGARPSECVFTAGGTEANNLAIHGVLKKYPDGHIVTTALEHESVHLPARCYDVAEVAPNEQGIVSADSIGAAITDKTVLVSVMYANNEIGTIQPIKQIAQIVAAIRVQRQASGNTLPLYLHTDAAQAGNYLDMHVHRLGVDLMTINGGKLYGPKQSGVLYVRAGVLLDPLIQGGGQEGGLRSGTENVAGCVGFATALHEAEELRDTEVTRLRSLQKRCIDALSDLSGVIINGSQKLRLPNNIHASFAGQDNERLLYTLEAHGIICAAGSACSASKEEASHVLLGMGLSETEARSSLRFTFGRQTTEEEVAQLITTLKEVAQAA